jgi:uncharacterized protein (DUF302 family)
MRILLTLFLALFLTFTITGCNSKESTTEQEGAIFWGAQGDQERKFKILTDVIENIGFRLSDPHERVNDGYVKKYGETSLDNLGFFSIAHDEKLKDLLEKYPALAGFGPFNMHVYKKKSEDVTWVGHLNPKVMADIVGLQDPEARKTFISSFEPLDKLMQETMGTTKTRTVKFNALPKETMMTFEFPVEFDPDSDEGEEVTDFVDAFQEKFEEAFEDNDYIIAGYKNFKENYDDQDIEFAYDAFWVYSLCHFKFSNDVFNDIPEAGVFAPCSVYMYIKPGEKTLHVGMPRISNWKAVFNVEDEEKIKLMDDLDSEIISIFKSIGGKHITNEKSEGAPKKVGATLWGTAGDQERKFKILTDEIENIGFVLSDPHERVNDGYEKKYGGTKLDNLGFFSVAHDEKLRNLLEKYPALAGFGPFNMHVFKKKDENVTWVGHLDPTVMADIVGLKDNVLRQEFIESFKPLDTMMKETMGTTQERQVAFNQLPDEPMMAFEFPIEYDPDSEEGEELTDFIDGFQETFEETFEENNYIIAGYKNFKENYEDAEMEFAYDAFWVYSLCHFKFSNDVFNDLPEAGIFAPCSVYMYVKPGGKTLHVGMAKIANWKAVFEVSDPKTVKLMDDLDAEIISVFQSLGGKYLGTTGANSAEVIQKSAKEESKVNVAPKEREKVTLDEGQEPTYLVADFVDEATATQSLKTAGFEVLGSYNVVKGGSLKTIVFTNDTLKSLASNHDRGFIGVLKLLINQEANEIRISNPKYFAKAFMQDEYKEGSVDALAKTLQGAFSNVGPSSDHLVYDDLEDYHFMMGMPYYKDMIELASGDQTTLVEKAQESDSLIFDLELANGSHLVGLELGKKTKKFVKKIGTQNSALLPYMVLIENGKARMLDPKYYIAISYPQLSMSQFTTIATIPGAIENELGKVFK